MHQIWIHLFDLNASDLFAPDLEHQIGIDLFDINAPDLFAPDLD